jgi:hypothetical protein
LTFSSAIFILLNINASVASMEEKCLLPSIVCLYLTQEGDCVLLDIEIPSISLVSLIFNRSYVLFAPFQPVSSAVHIAG